METSVKCTLSDMGVVSGCVLLLGIKANVNKLRCNSLA